MKNILVTGGAGYIGSHTCKALASAGYHPITIDNLSTGNKWAVQWGPIYQSNISQKEVVAKIVKEHKIEAAIHFAASAYVGESVTNPLKYYQNNVFESIAFVNALIESGVQKIVFSSSCATYGTPKQVPINETHPQNPINPYGRTKFYIEKFLEDLAAAKQIDFIALRYFNASGANESATIGEIHKPETHLLPLAILNAIGKFGALTVYGDDYETADGTCIRDYIHVDDLAQAHLRALQQLENRKHSTHFYNLGIGHGYSVKEVIAAVEAVTLKKVEFKIGARRPGDPAKLVAHNALATQQLHWKPQYQDIEAIIHSAVQFYLKNEQYL